MIKSKLEGFKIFEMPIIWEEPEGRNSKVNILIDGIRMGFGLLKMRIKL